MFHTRQPRLPAVLLSLAVAACLTIQASAAEYLSGVQWDEPKVINPGGPVQAPSDAVVLFDGTDMSAWEGAENWKVEDGAVISGPGAIQSKAEFSDCQLHIEFASDTNITGEGQGRSNSGVFLMGNYEVQVLDSYGNETYFDGQCGAIYKQHPPLVNACRAPGEWQTYDILWTAPRFKKNGDLISPAFITVLHNGVLIQNHFELEGDTPFNRPPAYKAHPPKGPIGLQYHGNAVRFRNIWVRNIQEVPSQRVHEPKIVEKKPAKKPAKKDAAEEKPAEKKADEAKPAEEQPVAEEAAEEESTTPGTTGTVAPRQSRTRIFRRR